MKLNYDFKTRRKMAIFFQRLSQNFSHKSCDGYSDYVANANACSYGSNNNKNQRKPSKLGKFFLRISCRMHKKILNLPAHPWGLKSSRTLINTPEELQRFVRLNAISSEMPEYFTVQGELVIILKGENNSQVYLIGTNHISSNSARAANLLIQSVKPHIVVTELDKSRAGLNRTSIVFSGIPYKYNYKFLRIAMSEFGLLGGVIFFTLAFMETFIGRLLNVNWGADLRTPFLVTKTALDFMPREYTNERKYEILLGDRPIEVTFKRMGLCLSSLQKSFIICTALLSVFLGLKCLLLMVSIRLNKNPDFEKVLVHERDVYLTYSLQEATKMKFDGPTKVVGIVGKDHVPGIVKMWGTVTMEHVEKVMKV